ncbi:MAG: hypothetical protein WC612_06985 [Bdellovibrionales bacterium]|jgi:hypothetical protein
MRKFLFLAVLLCLSSPVMAKGGGGGGSAGGGHTVQHPTLTMDNDEGQHRTRTQSQTGEEAGSEDHLRTQNRDQLKTMDQDQLKTMDQDQLKTRDRDRIHQ